MRDYIHIIDICRSIEKSLIYLFKEKNMSKIINIGNGIGISNLQIVDAVKKIMKSKLNLYFTKRRTGDNAKSVCNINNANKSQKLIKY